MTFDDHPQTASPRETEPLRKLGWDDSFNLQSAAEGSQRGHAARVLSVQRGLFLISDGVTEQLCTPTGKMRHSTPDQYPVTGDWVLACDGTVTDVLPRRNILSRGEAGSRGGRNEYATREQPIGANIDTVFIVCGLDRDYNLRRIERYLALVYNCGISPVIVLTKADLQDDPESFRQEAEAIAFGVPIVLTSMQDDSGLDELSAYFESGQTVAMLGSSGAGKSTLANRLFGSDIQATGAVGDKLGKGRHTTTTRELIRMPRGGLLMDNPGIREIAFYSDGDGLDAAFPEILELSALCRFADCTHAHEPGCAVRQAVDDGELPHERLASYHKMRREMDYASARAEKSADRVEKERWKDIAMKIKRFNKNRP